ncbi:DUF3794 domain-containing protein [Lachnospiraceae bacterium ZAX-1]
MNREKGKASSQITLDDDFNVPDSKPDLIRVIQDKGEIRIDETTITQGHVWLKGALNFRILYRNDQEEKKINSLTGEIPFQESLVIDRANEYDAAKIKWEIEDLSISVINTRKLSVKALVVLSATIDEIFDEEMVTGAEREEGVEILEKELTTMQLLVSKKDMYRFKEEIVLPSNKPNIREVLWKSVQLRSVENRLMENKIMIKGEVLVFVLYLGEEEEERLQWIETALPFQGMIDCAGSTEDMIYDVSYDASAIELEPKPDYDGEERMLHLEVVLDLDIHIYEEERTRMLEDIYAVNANLQPQYEDAVFEKLLIKNFSKCRVSDRITVAQNQEGILQICASEGNVSVDSIEIVTDGIQVEGTLNIQLLYITSDDKMPIATLKDMIPFHHTIEATKITKESRYEMKACLEQLTTIMLDSSQVEVKAVIDLDSIVFEKQPMNKLVDVVEEPMDMEALQESPGIIGYIARVGDRLWDIAKENYTTIANIKETNQLTDNTLREGDKILIIKTVS